IVFLPGRPSPPTSWPTGLRRLFLLNRERTTPPRQRGSAPEARPPHRSRPPGCDRRSHRRYSHISGFWPDWLPAARPPSWWPQWALRRKPPNARFEVLGQTEVIPLRDGLQDLLVELRGFVISVVMREIGAGYDERARPRPLEHFSEREPEGSLRLIALLAHHDGNQLEVAQHALQKGELHFQGMLSLLLGWHVAAAGKPDERVQLGQLGGKLLVHRDISERRGIGIAVVNRNEREALEMRGRNHH